MEAVAAVKQEMCRAIGSRHEAADILRKVAEMGSYGSFPSDVTCEELGRALSRICINSPSTNTNPLAEIVRGYLTSKYARMQGRSRQSIRQRVQRDFMELRRSVLSSAQATFDAQRSPTVPPNPFDNSS